MTRLEELKSMSDKNLNRLVAEQVIGLIPRMVRVVYSSETVEFWTQNPAIVDGIWTKEELIRYGQPLPYAGNYNDAATVRVEIERRGLCDVFRLILCDLVYFESSNGYWRMINATPRETCIAAILAVEGVR